MKLYTTYMLLQAQKGKGIGFWIKLRKNFDKLSHPYLGIGNFYLVNRNV